MPSLNWFRADGSAKGKDVPDSGTSVKPHQLAVTISCHAWNQGQTILAVCPNSSEVHLYKNGGGELQKFATLKEHTQLVSGLQWSPRSNMLLSCSHDRNAFVWKDNGASWEPVLVVLRLNRAALCCSWSPSENKFAIGSGAKTVCVCYYEEENDWWVSKHIKKKHSSSVLDVAWHPNNVILATTSSDFRCRVFSAFIKGVDKKDEAAHIGGGDKFGDALLEIDCGQGWAHQLSWSPSGTQLAFVGHDCTLHYVQGLTGVGEGWKDKAGQVASIRFNSLPFTAVQFLSESTIVAGGFDCVPVVFTDSGRGFLPEKVLKEKKEEGAQRQSSQFRGAFDKFRAQAEQGLKDMQLEDSGPEGPHKKCITQLALLASNSFSSTGLDGKVCVWTL